MSIISQSISTAEDVSGIENISDRIKQTLGAKPKALQPLRDISNLSNASFNDTTSSVKSKSVSTGTSKIPIKLPTADRKVHNKTTRAQSSTPKKIVKALDIHSDSNPDKPYAIIHNEPRRFQESPQSLELLVTEAREENVDSFAASYSEIAVSTSRILKSPHTKKSVPFKSSSPPIRKLPTNSKAKKLHELGQYRGSFSPKYSLIGPAPIKVTLSSQRSTIVVKNAPAAPAEAISAEGLQSSQVVAKIALTEIRFQSPSVDKIGGNVAGGQVTDQPVQNSCRHSSLRTFSVRQIASSMYAAAVSVLRGIVMYSWLRLLAFTSAWKAAYDRMINLFVTLQSKFSSVPTKSRRSRRRLFLIFSAQKLATASHHTALSFLALLVGIKKSLWLRGLGVIAASRAVYDQMLNYLVSLQPKFNLVPMEVRPRKSSARPGKSPKNSPNKSSGKTTAVALRTNPEKAKKSEEKAPIRVDVAGGRPSVGLSGITSPSATRFVFTYAAVVLTLALFLLLSLHAWLSVSHDNSMATLTRTAHRQQSFPVTPSSQVISDSHFSNILTMSPVVQENSTALLSLSPPLASTEGGETDRGDEAFEVPSSNLDKVVLSSASSGDLSGVGKIKITVEAAEAVINNSSQSESRTCLDATGSINEGALDGSTQIKLALDATEGDDAVEGERYTSEGAAVAVAVVSDLEAVGEAVAVVGDSEAVAVVSDLQAVVVVSDSETGAAAVAVVSDSAAVLTDSEAGAVVSDSEAGAVAVAVVADFSTEVAEMAPSAAQKVGTVKQLEIVCGDVSASSTGSCFVEASALVTDVLPQVDNDTSSQSEVLDLPVDDLNVKIEKFPDVVKDYVAAGINVSADISSVMMSGDSGLAIKIGSVPDAAVTMYNGTEDVEKDLTGAMAPLIHDTTSNLVSENLIVTPEQSPIGFADEPALDFIAYIATPVGLEVASVLIVTDSAVYDTQSTVASILSGSIHLEEEIDIVMLTDTRVHTVTQIPDIKATLLKQSVDQAVILQQLPESVKEPASSRKDQSIIPEQQQKQQQPGMQESVSKDRVDTLQQLPQASDKVEEPAEDFIAYIATPAGPKIASVLIITETAVYDSQSDVASVLSGTMHLEERFDIAMVTDTRVHTVTQVPDIKATLLKQSIVSVQDSSRESANSFPVVGASGENIKSGGSVVDVASSQSGDDGDAVTFADGLQPDLHNKIKFDIETAGVSPPNEIAANVSKHSHDDIVDVSVLNFPSDITSCVAIDADTETAAKVVAVLYSELKIDHPINVSYSTAVESDSVDTEDYYDHRVLRAELYVEDMKSDVSLVHAVSNTWGVTGPSFPTRSTYHWHKPGVPSVFPSSAPTVLPSAPIPTRAPAFEPRDFVRDGNEVGDESSMSSDGGKEDSGADGSLVEPQGSAATPSDHEASIDVAPTTAVSQDQVQVGELASETAAAAKGDEALSVSMQLMNAAVIALVVVGALLLGLPGAFGLSQGHAFGDAEGVISVTDSSENEGTGETEDPDTLLPGQTPASITIRRKKMAGATPFHHAGLFSGGSNASTSVSGGSRQSSQVSPRTTDSRGSVGSGLSFHSYVSGDGLSPGAYAAAGVNTPCVSETSFDQGDPIYADQENGDFHAEARPSYKQHAAQAVMDRFASRFAQH